MDSTCYIVACAAESEEGGIFRYRLLKPLNHKIFIPLAKSGNHPELRRSKSIPIDRLRN